MKDYNKYTSDLTILPRIDLREPAFRRYEQYISRALTTREYKINVGLDFLMNDQSKFKRAMSPRTFCTRLRDAILGYNRFHYKSDLIPQGANLDGIQAYETTTNDVIIINHHIAPTPQFFKTEFENLHAKDRELITTLVNRKKNDQDVMYYTPLEVSYDDQTQKSWLISLLPERVLEEGDKIVFS